MIPCPQSFPNSNYTTDCPLFLLRKCLTLYHCVHEGQIITARIKGSIVVGKVWGQCRLVLRLSIETHALNVFPQKVRSEFHNFFGCFIKSPFKNVYKLFAKLMLTCNISTLLNGVILDDNIDIYTSVVNCLNFRC